VMKGIDDNWQIDLVEMHKFAKFNKGFNYILTCIDIFSKRGYAVPVKNKTAKDVTSAFNEIITNSGKKPKNVHSDMGREFYNSSFKELMKKYDINHYSTYSTMKAMICERFNRSLKNIMYRQFTLQGSYKWLSLLPRVVDIYNSNHHRTIGMKPMDVRKKHEERLLKTVYQNQDPPALRFKFKVNDKVRISKSRTVFSRGYNQAWTNEIFTVRQVKKTNPPTYLLNDYQGNPVLGSFYDLEMQLTKLDDIYFVEKILKKSGKQLFVKWLGFDDSHNSWIKNDDIIK